MDVLRIKSMLIMWGEDYVPSTGTRQEQVKWVHRNRVWLARSLSPQKVLSVQISQPPL